MAEKSAAPQQPGPSAAQPPVQQQPQAAQKQPATSPPQKPLAPQNVRGYEQFVEPCNPAEKVRREQRNG